MARWNRLTKESWFFDIWKGAGTITKNDYLLRANRQYARRTAMTLRCGSVAAEHNRGIICSRAAGLDS